MQQNAWIILICLGSQLTFVDTEIMVFPADNYTFKVNNRYTRTRCEICSKLTIKTSEQRHWHRSGVFIANFEKFSHLVLVFLLLTLLNDG